MSLNFKECCICGREPSHMINFKIICDRMKCMLEALKND